MIDMVPDVALLEIFDFYVDDDDDDADLEDWHTLVHVCRKWRNVVFGSPRRLNLRLYCTARTPVKETIDAWPLLPIIVWGDGHKRWGVDNIIAALEHNDRIHELYLLRFTSSQMEKVLPAMLQPFPALEYLRLCSIDESKVVPASFLGGSAPQLRSLWLTRFLFPGLPKLLLSATHLVYLFLIAIPHSGYFSPEAIVTSLSALTSLETLHIGFKSPRSRPDRRRHPPPLTRTLLPALTDFEFHGVSEYLEDLVARIDAPLLDKFLITFFHQLIFDTPQLTQFISRTPNFKTCDDARVQFSGCCLWVSTIDKTLELQILCKPSDWQLSSLAQVCGSIFISPIEYLYISEGLRPDGERTLEVLPELDDLVCPTRGGRSWSWQDDIETGQWLEVLEQLTAVKDLRISQKFTPLIAPTLQELVGERVAEVLPALQTLFLEETLPSGVQESIDKFVAARELAGHPITVSRWEESDEESDEDLDSD